MSGSRATLIRSILAARTRQKPKFDLRSILFGPQYSFVTDKAEFKTAVCSRRAGKTVGCATALLASNLKNPKAPSLYFTLTRGSAKRNVWPTLLELNRKYQLGYEPNESELVLKRNGFAAIVLSGADNSSEIEKWRGTAWGKVVGDEAQAFPSYLKEAVTEVLMPALMDYRGTLDLIGTPSAVPVGYFYECTQNEVWSHHTWTVFQNPHIEDPAGYLQKVLKVRGVTEDDPGIQREFYGRWAYDPDALVFKFDASRNTYEGDNPLRSPEYILGIDLGFDDSDAVVALGFSKESPNVYLADEFVSPKQTITELMRHVQPMVEKYKPNAIVIDAGGLGKKIAEEIQMRWGIHLKAAEKRDKFGHIELVNDALRTGRLKVKRTSKFASDALLVEWDKDKSTNDKRYISDRYHSDICDALLYAFRESLHWTHTPVIEKPKAGSPAWLKEQEETMRREAEEALTREKEDLGDEEWFYRSR